MKNPQAIPFKWEKLYHILTLNDSVYVYVHVFVCV